MKSLLKTAVFTLCFFCAGTVFAIGGNDHHSALIKIGEQNSESWSIIASQFGKMNADSKELVFTLTVTAYGNADLNKVETLRIWFGDVDSESRALNFVGQKNDEGMLVFHSHLAKEKGDDYTQFTVEVDTGSDEGELLSFKTK